MIERVERNYFHWAFEIGVVLKGINGALETLGGILLFLFPTSALNQTVVRLTQGELAEDPRDIVANALLHWSHTLSTSSKLFGAVYLLSHGIIKLALVIGLLKRRLWAYPASLLFLLVFILYQLYRLEIGYSTGMMLLTVLDVIVVLLVWREYRIVSKTL